MFIRKINLVIILLVFLYLCLIFMKFYNTIAALTGDLSALLYDLPDDWIYKIPKKEIIEQFF